MVCCFYIIMQKMHDIPVGLLAQQPTADWPSRARALIWLLYKWYYAWADHYLWVIICRSCGWLFTYEKEENIHWMIISAIWFRKWQIMEVVSTLLKPLFHLMDEMKMRYECHMHTCKHFMSVHPFLVGRRYDFSPKECCDICACKHSGSLDVCWDWVSNKSNCY